MSDLLESGVAELSAMLVAKDISAREVAAAHLARIAAVDGTHSFEGAPDAVNAWVRVYEERALSEADRADQMLARGTAHPLCGVPYGLKDLYAVAGEPLTASSRVIDERPTQDCDVAAALSAAGMVLLGHTHTHEFAAGGSTDQTGNPWDLTRTAGGSSGGSAAALASGSAPLATGTDTAGSLRIPSALTGVSTIKLTRGRVPLRGIVPLSHSLDHAGPMARDLRDCAFVLPTLVGADARLPGWGPGELDLGTTRELRGARIAVSPRVGMAELDPDVAEGFDATLDALRRSGASVLDAGAPETPLDLGMTFLDVLSADMLAWHAPHLERARGDYRQSIRDLLEYAEQRAMTAVEYAGAQWDRMAATAAWSDWMAAEGIDAIVEPTVPMVAPLRGQGYDAFFTDEAIAYIAYTSTWNWTGFPVVALPSGVGSRSGLPTGVSLIGASGTDGPLLDLGIALQDELGVPDFPVL